MADDSKGFGKGFKITLGVGAGIFTLVVLGLIGKWAVENYAPVKVAAFTCFSIEECKAKLAAAGEKVLPPAANNQQQVQQNPNPQQQVAPQVQPNPQQQVAANQAPTVGQQLPKDMVPGNWYATGNNKVVPAGTKVDTNPYECERGGVKGQCGLRKRGS